MKRKKLQNGYIFYHGPSMIDGKPIVAIAMGFKQSRNSKTGDVIQTNILRSDIAPIEAIHSGQDYSICGACPFRKANTPGKMGTLCYVNHVTQHQIFLKLHGKAPYPIIPNWSIFDGLTVRLGTYGDPAALPIKILESLKGQAQLILSYTHQWPYKRFGYLKDFCMASVENIQRMEQAWAMGFKTFRVAPSDKPLALQKKEIECLSDKKGMTCKDCTICKGGPGPNVAIVVHGLNHKINGFNKLFGVKGH